MPRPTSSLLVAAAGAVTSACGILGPDSASTYEVVVERFEVTEEVESWAPYPIGYLSVELALVNTRPDTLRLEYGACVLEVVARRRGSGGSSLWRSLHSGSWPHGSPSVCLAYLRIVELAPGDTLRGREWERRFLLAEILADSLPAGPWRFEALTHLDGGARIQLGEAILPTTRFPLPERVAYRDGFRYEAQVEPTGTGGATIHLDVSFSAPASVGSLERTLSAECPVRVLGFRDATAPTTIPLPEPDWVWPESCDADGVSVRLGAGESRSFESRLSAARFAELGAGPGRYALMGIIDVDGRPIRMALGEVELAG